MTVKFNSTDGTTYELNRVAKVVDSGYGYYTFKPYKGATIQVRRAYYDYEWFYDWRKFVTEVKGGITII